jgi:hypothetical protein
MSISFFRSSEFQEIFRAKKNRLNSLIRISLSHAVSARSGSVGCGRLIRRVCPGENKIFLILL